MKRDVDYTNMRTIKKKMTIYEGCSNMNASSFITFVTYMLRQNEEEYMSPFNWHLT